MIMIAIHVPFTSSTINYNLIYLHGDISTVMVSNLCSFLFFFTF